MISVIIPTLNAASGLAATLSALVPAAIDGLVKEVIVSDGGSADATLDIADAMGASVVEGPRGRGAQLAHGASAAQSGWLLFLHADTVLAPGWIEEATRFLSLAERTQNPPAAVFRFALDDLAPAARRIEWWARLRARVLALPYGDQGLLVSRKHYDALGGFRPMPLMEDVDIIRRIGRARLVFLKSEAITSAKRYRAGGYWLRPARNLSILALYFLRVPPSVLARLYG